MRYDSPWTSQYYCALFRFARGLRQVNTSSYTDAACVTIALILCLNVLSDTDAACVATALTLLLKQVA